MGIYDAVMLYVVIYSNILNSFLDGMSFIYICTYKKKVKKYTIVAINIIKFTIDNWKERIEYKT